MVNRSAFMGTNPENAAKLFLARRSKGTSAIVKQKYWGVSYSVRGIDTTVA